MILNGMFFFPIVYNFLLLFKPYLGRELPGRKNLGGIGRQLDTVDDDRNRKPVGNGHHALSGRERRLEVEKLSV